MPTTVNVAAFASGDAIPLMDDAGGGVYTQGRNNAKDIRQGLFTALAASNGSAFGRRVGVIPTTRASGSSGVYSDFQVVGQGTPSTTVTLKGGQAILARSGEGYYLASMISDQNFTMDPANGSNPRWDVVWIKLFDKAAFGADPQHGPWIGVTYGDPAGSPTVPSIPTDALEVARIRRAAGSPGDQIGSGSTPITLNRKSTMWQGGVRPLLEGDALTDAGGYHGELRLRSAPSGLTSISSATELIDRWSQIDSAWHGTTMIPLNTISQTSSGGVSNGSTLTLATVTIPDLGFNYRISASAGAEYFCADANALIGLGVNINSSNVDTNRAAFGLDKNNDGVGASKGVFASGESSTTLSSGPHGIWLNFKNYNGGSGATVASGGAYSFHVTIVPV